MLWPVEPPSAAVMAIPPCIRPSPTAQLIRQTALAATGADASAVGAKKNVATDVTAIAPRESTRAETPISEPGRIEHHLAARQPSLKVFAD